MDQSFNDQELSDIMKEIEALEEDFEASSETGSGSVLEELAQLEEGRKKPETSGNLVSMGTLKSEITEKSETTPSKKFHPEMNSETNPASITATSSTFATTSLKFKVSGDLCLDLELEIGKKVVSLKVSESGLSIEMDGGMKFIIPSDVKAGHKKAS
jgi:hypothetical protein